MTSGGWTIRGCDRRENLLGRRWGKEKRRERESEIVSIKDASTQYLPHIDSSNHKVPSCFLMCCMFYRWIPCYKASTPNEPSSFPSTQSWNEGCSRWLCLPRSCCLFIQKYGFLADSFEVCFLLLCQCCEALKSVPPPEGTITWIE